MYFNVVEGTNSNGFSVFHYSINLINISVFYITYDSK